VKRRGGGVRRGGEEEGGVERGVEEGVRGWGAEFENIACLVM
jgi:hypothetical protein